MKLTINILMISYFLANISYSQDTIKMQWGLQNETFYAEHKTKDLPDSIDGVRKYLPPNSKEFSLKEQVAIDNGMLDCFRRHNMLWSKYTEKCSKENRETQKEEFENYKKSNDLVCGPLFKTIAPELYFDFISSSSDQYVLDSIIIETIEFSEYKGGGFVEKEAWYDIILSPQTGIKSYPVEPKLVFTGTGRVQLRFWSANYYSSRGWISPMGAYILKITFKFLVKGKLIEVSTDKFLMDV